MREKMFLNIFSLRGIAMSLLLIFLSLWSSGCSTFKTFSLESIAPFEQIIIDGRYNDWHGHLYIAEEARLSLGFLNDQDYLYVCLIAEDPLTRGQIMRRGLIVWFDPRGKKKKSFGIKYPIGMPAGEKLLRPDEERDRGFAEDFPEKAFSELEIIKTEKAEPQKISLEEAKGIEVKVAPWGGILVYELKIPLIATEQHPFAIGAQPGKKIGVGFETPEFDPTQMSRRGPGRIPGGGSMPPMVGGRRRGMIGFGMMSRMPEEIKIWAIVQLAAVGSSSSLQILSIFKLPE